MATPMQSMLSTIGAISQCSSREKAVNCRRSVAIGYLPAAALVAALGCFVSPARLVNDCAYTAERALSKGSSDGTIPAGNTSGSKLMS